MSVGPVPMVMMVIGVMRMLMCHISSKCFPFSSVVNLPSKFDTRYYTCQEESEEEEEEVQVGNKLERMNP
jgi:hypothetical protein